MTDTPIYDQLRLELSSRRSVPDSPPQQRSRSDERAPAAKPVRPVAAAKPVVSETETRKSVSVWTLVNANRNKN